MPMYSYHCNECKESFEGAYPMSEAAHSQACPKCRKLAQRTYEFQTQSEYVAFYDEQYKCMISSRGQEKKLMKKHGHINIGDTDAPKKFKDARKWMKNHGDMKGWNASHVTR